VISGCDLQAIAAELLNLRDALLAAEDRRRTEIDATHPRHRRSAANLVHYVELRRHDLRALQPRLAALGLSSLGRSEAHVMASLDAVLDRLAAPDGRTAGTSSAGGAPRTASAGRTALAENAQRLLGSPRAHRSARIMVTLPSEAADDDLLVAALADAGMDLARINCAHDSEAAWARMVVSVRTHTEGRRPAVAMDLAGPKLRTGPLEPGPPVRRVAPHRAPSGELVHPAVVALVADSSGPRSSVDPALVPYLTDPEPIPVCDATWLRRRTVGEVIVLTDRRGSHRRWTVVSTADAQCLVSVDKTTYVETGTCLRAGDNADPDVVTLGALEPLVLAHRVVRGDEVVVTRDLTPAVVVEGARSHRIGCTLPEVFDAVAPGHRILFDDGKLGGIVDHVSHEAIHCTITDVRPGGAKLREGKGINLPDTELGVASLTEKDLADLPFVAAHADLVNVSFVRTPSDVADVLARLRELDAEHLGVVLKIENRTAFEQLPALLLAALQSERVGVMIARGDLAVEVGFDRLAEVQEEILWACEAAHVPVIWATQVLDTLARTGRASRAEITDAAMAERAECVMLNKGPFLLDAIDGLDSILGRMQAHQDKKRSLLRRLRAWDRPGPVGLPGTTT
jgi:pyruvate kinase